MTYRVSLSLGVSGLSLTLKILNGTVVELSQSLPEQSISGVIGHYATTVSSGPTDGTYDMVAVTNSGEIYAFGQITLLNGEEISNASAEQVWSYPSRTLNPRGGVTHLY